MPGFSALTALAILKDREIDIPFIIVSGNMSEEVAVTAMKAGAHDFFVKGKLARLIAAIERKLAEAEVRRTRKRAEADLRESEARNRVILESFPDIVFVVDPNEKILFSNPTAAQLLDHLGLNGQLPAEIDQMVRRVIETGVDHLPTDFARTYRVKIRNEDRFFLPRVIAMHTETHPSFCVIRLLED